MYFLFYVLELFNVIHFDGKHFLLWGVVPNIVMLGYNVLLNKPFSVTEGKGVRKVLNLRDILLHQ